MRYFTVFALIIALAVLAGCGGGNSSLVTRPSGVQYRDVSVGTGVPVPNNVPTGMELVMKLENGTVVFDSATEQQPVVVTLGANNDMLPGLKEGLAGICYGAHRIITVPPSMAYGKEGNSSSNIPPNATLICDVRFNWSKTESGIQYFHTVEGTGASPTIDDTIKVHYSLWNADGTFRESSRDDSGEPFVQSLSGLIEAWKELIPTMKVGGKLKMVVPPEMAYNDGKTLVFEVELLDINPEESED